MNELLTPEEMGEADRLAIADGLFDGYRLMRNAGAAVVAEILRRFPDFDTIDVLCGPGNNGGDGYVVAELLAASGLVTRVWHQAAPRSGSDAARAAADWGGNARPLEDFSPSPDAVVIDALFGAGLVRELGGSVAAAVHRTIAAGSTVVAIDLPSGVSGLTGQVLGTAFAAELTVTFFRRKPGHLLLPGRERCGELVVADIGIPDTVLERIAPAAFANEPAEWIACLPVPMADSHKYSRGHAAVFSGGPGATGAARLAARGAARAGAGAVTLLSPASAMLVNAAHLTAIMLRKVETDDDLRGFLAERRPNAVALGPGFGDFARARDFAATVLEDPTAPALVLDADAITAFRDQPETLYAAARRRAETGLVLTPHAGEFERLFPDLAGDTGLSKLDRARKAAQRANAVVVFKGADTVIAAPDGRAAINTNGTPWLATAGSGDVLTGFVTGLCSQGMPLFEAACASVWLHAEAAAAFGPGLIAEDLPEILPDILDAFY